MIVANKYKISWTHTRVIPKGSKYTRIVGTQCTIETLLGSIEYQQPETWQTYTTGIAITHPNDAPNRKLGNKISFERAVAKIDDKATRKLLWEAYLNTQTPKPVIVEVTLSESDKLITLLEMIANKTYSQGKATNYSVTINSHIFNFKKVENAPSKDSGRFTLTTKE